MKPLARLLFIQLGILVFTVASMLMGEAVTSAETGTSPAPFVLTSAVPAQNTNFHQTALDGILTNPNFRIVLHALQQRRGFENLAEPEVTTTTSGRGINSIMVSNISVPISNIVSESSGTGIETSPAEDKLEMDHLTATTNLSVRRFRIDPFTFSNNLQKCSVLQATNVTIMAKKYFGELGVNFDLSGRSLYVNEKLGLLILKATDRDLDYVGSLIQRFNQSAPLIHIKSYYFETPKGTVASFGNAVILTNSTADAFTGILNAKEAGVVLNSLRSRKDVKMLFDPVCFTGAGRQSRLEPVTRTGSNLVMQKTPATVFDRFAYLNSLGWKVETNLVLNVVPTILPDGYTISLEIIPSEAGFYAHDKPAGGHFTTISLTENQTVVWGGLEKNFVLDDNGVTSQSGNDKELLVFITATIVDEAGNRVHSDDELPFAQNGVPPQPAPPK